MAYTITSMSAKLNNILTNTYLFFLSFFLFVFHGYKYGHWEQTFYIPMIKHLLDPAFLAQDWFVNLAPYHHNVLQLQALLSKFIGLPFTMAFLYIFCVSIYVWFSYYISLELFKNKNAALLSVFLLSLIIPHGLGGSRMLQVSFVPRLLGLALLLISLLYFLRNKHVLAFLFAFLAGKAHLLIGLNWLFIISLYYLFFYKQKYLKIQDLLWIVFFFVILLLPDIARQLKLIFAQPVLSSLQNVFININVNLRFPQHYLTLYTGPLGLLYAALTLLFLWYFQPLIKDKYLRSKYLFLISIISIFVLINLLFVDIFSIKLIAKLQLLRLSYLLQYLFFMSFSAFLVSLLDKKQKVLPGLIYIFIIFLPVLVNVFPENYKSLTMLWLIFLIIRLANIKSFGSLKNRVGQLLKKAPRLFKLTAAGIIISSILSFFLFSVLILPNKPEHIQCQLPKNTSSWLDLAYYVKKHTPKNSIFIIPPEQESFRMLAERAIVVDFKACPYLEKDAAEWKSRLDRITASDLYSLPQHGWELLPILEKKYKTLSTAQLKKIANKYQAKYIVTNKAQKLSLKKIYQNPGFSLYKI